MTNTQSTPTTPTPTDLRLAKLIFVSAEFEEHANERVPFLIEFGATPFEARLIELAYHWGNDLIELAGHALYGDEFDKAWASTGNYTTVDVWYTWYKAKVHELQNELRAAP